MVARRLSTPVSTPVVTLVVAPGGDSFVDFLKVGTPLTALVGFLTVAITPLFFPFWRGILSGRVAARRAPYIPGNTGHCGSSSQRWKAKVR